MGVLRGLPEHELRLRVGQRVGERHALVRLSAPVPGMLTAFAYGEGEGTATVGVRAYLFSADAADWVRREEPGWTTWLQELAVPA